MKIQKIEVLNYKSLKGKHEFTLNGQSFFIMGGNGKGKSTVGKAIIDALTKRFPSQPITEGEKEGYIEFTLSDGSTIYCRFKEDKKPVLEVISKDGQKITATKELLAVLSGKGMSFDIDEFLSLQPKPRRQMLEQIQGIDFTAINQKEALLMEQRSDIAREIKRQEGRVEDFDESLLEQPYVDVEQTNRTLSSYLSLNTEIQQVFQQKESLLRIIKEKYDQIKRLQEELYANSKQIEGIDEFLTENEPISQDEIDKAKETIANANEINNRIQAAKRQQAERDELEKLNEQHETIKAKIEGLRYQKDVLIQENPLPADGLAFGENDDLLLHGLPFEDKQIATSAKVIAGLQIAESVLGDIRYIHFDASILDQENANKVCEWAESKDLQLCLERAIWEGGELKLEIIEP